jgi:hypothetical protein
MIFFTPSSHSVAFTPMKRTKTIKPPVIALVLPTPSYPPSPANLSQVNMPPTWIIQIAIAGPGAGRTSPMQEAYLGCNDIVHDNKASLSEWVSDPKIINDDPVPSSTKQ